MISNYLDLIVSFNLSTKYLKYKLAEADGTVVNFGRICYKGGKTTWTSSDRAVYLDYQNDVHNSLFFIRKGLIKNINVLYFDSNFDNNDPTFVYYITRVDKNDYHLLIDYK